MTIPNILAERYASSEMRQIWDPKNKIIEERKLWITVMKAQSKLGLNIKESEIQKYQDVLEIIDFDSIKNREIQRRHDVKARIEEFNALAGLELIHIGMTSRDLTENVELNQIYQSLKLTSKESKAVLMLIAEKMTKYSDLVMVGRSHNIPAQVTTLGKRFASIAEELLFAIEKIDFLIERFPLRGIRGPVGTAQDMSDLFGANGAESIDAALINSMQMSRVLNSTGQIYPRSIDLEVISTLLQLAAAPSSLAINIRLMSGAGLLSEGFGENQVGSSAMPHKINPSASERINALTVLLRGYQVMAADMAGSQWNEGDVSCSVIRRVILPDSFYVIDGIFQTLAKMVTDLQVNLAQIESEITKELPFLSTTRLLNQSVKLGLSREKAYKAIQRSALRALEQLNSGEEIQFAHLLSQESDFPLSYTEIQKLSEEIRQPPPTIKRQISNLEHRISSVVGNDVEILEWKWRNDF